MAAKHHPSCGLGPREGKGGGEGLGGEPPPLCPSPSSLTHCFIHESQQKEVQL